MVGRRKSIAINEVKRKKKVNWRERKEKKKGFVVHVEELTIVERVKGLELFGFWTNLR